MHHRVWAELYRAAIVETDDKMMPNRLQLAKAAIVSRLHVLQLDHGGTPEGKAGHQQCASCSKCTKGRG
jgi:hypothetical protein